MNHPNILHGTHSICNGAGEESMAITVVKMEGGS